MEQNCSIYIIREKINFSSLKDICDEQKKNRLFYVGYSIVKLLLQEVKIPKF